MILPTRRTLLAASAALAAAPAVGRAQPFSSRRPAPAKRRFTSPAVEALIAEVSPAIGDPTLRWMFGNCLPNTLDTTVFAGERDGRPDTYVITGDIDAMWLRDSSCQVQPYLSLCARDAGLKRMVAGLIRRQADCILIDPYANAFLRDPRSTTPLPWARADKTEMKPGVGERKWELDSLLFPIRLAHGYWAATGDASPFDARWRAAMAQVVRTLRAQQRLDGPGPYHFQREAFAPTETLMLDGYGAPTRKVGLIHSMFRPSDDACIYPFLIPSNLFAVSSLRQLSALLIATGGDPALAQAARALAGEVETAVRAHGVMRHADGAATYAYEADGYGNAVFMDDANAPSLLSIAYLGAVSANDPLYRAGRARTWSPANPYFFKGSAGEGEGGPHEGLGMIWPMSICYRALTSDNDGEILGCLAMLKGSQAGTGFMHEAFQADDPAHFTRPWFAWANSLYGELILKLYAERPGLLARPLPEGMG